MDKNLIKRAVSKFFYIQKEEIKISKDKTYFKFHGNKMNLLKTEIIKNNLEEEFNVIIFEVSNFHGIVIENEEVNIKIKYKKEKDEFEFVDNPYVLIERNKIYLQIERHKMEDVLQKVIVSVDELNNNKLKRLLNKNKEEYFPHLLEMEKMLKVHTDFF